MQFSTLIFCATICDNTASSIRGDIQMRFKRISTDTVRCIVTLEELKENGLEMNDFLSNNAKTEEFLRKIIEQAEAEVGFKVQGGPLTIQVAVLPENKLALTFSEKQTGNLMEFLEGLRAAMTNLKQAVSEKTEEPAEKMPDDKEQHEEFLLEFDDLDSLVEFCKGLPLDVEEQFRMDSELYLLEDENVYCLILKRGKMDDKQVCRIMSASIEFMDSLSVESSQVAYIREHGRCVLKECAIRQLQSMVQH